MLLVFTLYDHITSVRRPFFYDAFYEWNSHVKLVTVLSSCKWWWKPTWCKWRKFHFYTFFCCV